MTNETIEFKKELETLLNKYGKDAECRTPDYILAEHLWGYLVLYRETIQLNAGWHGWAE